MEKKAKRKFGLYSYRFRYTAEIFMLVFVICSILTMVFYKETLAIVQKNIQGNEEAVMQELLALRNKMYAMTALFEALALAVAFWIVQNIRKPLKKILEFAVALAGGDLTYRIQLKNRKDELGFVCENLNEAATKMEDIMVGIVSCAKDVNAAGEKLCANTDEIASRMQTINESAEEVVIGNEENQYNINNISDTMKRVDLSMHELAEYAKTQNQNAERCKSKALTAQKAAKAAFSRHRGTGS